MAYDVVVIELDSSDRKELYSESGKEILKRIKNFFTTEIKNSKCTAIVKFERIEKVELPNDVVIVRIKEPGRPQSTNYKYKKLIPLIQGIIQEAQEYLKKESCPLYSDCLDFALKSGWRQFSCLSCPIRGSEEENVTERDEIEELFRGLMESESIY